MYRLALVLAITLVPFSFQAQELKIQVNPIFNVQSLDLSGEFQAKEKCIKTFKCYLTSFELINEGNVVWKEENSYHLIDASLPESMLLELRIPEDLQYDQIAFLLGVDSLTSVSGAYGGDLDPTKGMYWAWNSGYVNFKLEGFHPRASSPEHDFEFHIGGYLPPFQTAQKITLSCAKNAPLVINIDLDQFLEKADLATLSQIMSPGKSAKELSQVAAQSFSTSDEK
jgi:hypothetical protein